jgi:hypothetical protein
LDWRLSKLGIVAIVKVGAVSEVSTPEGIVLQSARAHIEQLVYRRFPPAPELGEPEDEIIIYSLLPNGREADCPAPLTLKEGLAFVALPQNGVNKFHPEDPWSFQIIKDGRILWKEDESQEIREVDVGVVLKKIQDATAKTMKDEEASQAIQENLQPAPQLNR